MIYEVIHTVELDCYNSPEQETELFKQMIFHLDKLPKEGTRHNLFIKMCFEDLMNSILYTMRHLDVIAKISLIKRGNHIGFMREHPMQKSDYLLYKDVLSAVYENKEDIQNELFRNLAQGRVGEEREHEKYWDDLRAFLGKRFMIDSYEFKSYKDDIWILHLTQIVPRLEDQYY